VATLVIIFFSVLTVSLIVCIATAPWWFVRSLYRHRLWRMHDRLVLDIAEDRLPGTHPAVRQLLKRLEFAVDGRRRITMLDVLLVLFLRHRASPETRKYIDDSSRDRSLSGLSLERRQTVEGYRSQMATLIAGSMITGSWLGLFVLAVVLMPTTVILWRERRTVGFPQVADMAIERTHLVQPSVALSRDYERKQRDGALSLA
jgi:hypothetical protein